MARCTAPGWSRSFNAEALRLRPGRNGAIRPSGNPGDSGSVRTSRRPTQKARPAQLGARHGGYGGQWRDAVVDDLRKMESEPLIREAGLALVVFNEDESILAKDLELFESVLMRKEVLAGFRQVRTMPILDRIGHRVSTIAVWPTIQRQ